MRCTRCNMNVSKVYNGICPSCMSIAAKEKNDKVEAMINSQIVGNDLANPERLEEPGGFANMFKTDQSLTGRGTVSLAELEKADKVAPETGTVHDSTILYAYLRGNFTDKDKRAYKPTLKQLNHKYRLQLNADNYFICKKAEFGTTPGLGGRIIESKGGLVVVEKPIYKDPDFVEADPYEDDNKVLDLDATDEFDLGELDGV